ncbi:MAG: hypothetical protein EBU54_16515, partial [Mycobacteriaceae bacterium]|nr:hypothetical protein [Mycobacteriaceae bacterium]
TGLASDLVTLFAGLELVSIPTYILLALKRSDARGQEAGLKYFFLSLVASACISTITRWVSRRMRSIRSSTTAKGLWAASMNTDPMRLSTPTRKPPRASTTTLPEPAPRATRLAGRSTVGSSSSIDTYSVRRSV